MKKNIIVLILLFFSSIALFATSENTEDEPNKKLTLSRYYLKDAKISHLASDISNYIYRRKNGYNWPVTKIIFSHNEDKVLKLHIIAIDNEWNKLVDAGEIPYGYFVKNNRMFIIMTRDDCPMDLTEYFDCMDDDSKRNFFSSETKKVVKNPTWEYLFEPDSMFPKQLKSENLAVLGK